MRYTNYFSLVIKENGIPHLSPKTFRKMMNIVFLEGKLSGMRKLKEVYKGTDQYYKYDMLMFSSHKKLVELTQNTEPKILLKLMIEDDI